jgi:hypothetical protein
MIKPFLSSLWDLVLPPLDISLFNKAFTLLKYSAFLLWLCCLIDLGEWFSEERRITDEDESTSETKLATLQLSAADLELLDQD